MRDRGSALLISVIIIMVVFMIFGALIGVVNYNHSFETSEEKGIRAYYLAEAGTNYGIAMVKKDIETELNEAVRNEQESFKFNPLIYNYNNKILDNPFGDDYLGVISIDDITIDKEDVVTEVVDRKKGEEIIEQVVIVSANYVLTVTSTGYYPDKNGIKRTLQKQYTFNWEKKES